MSVIKSKFIYFIYFSISFFLLFEILFSEKNIFKFFNNFGLIKEYQITLKKKKMSLKYLKIF